MGRHFSLVFHALSVNLWTVGKPKQGDLMGLDDLMTSLSPWPSYYSMIQSQKSVPDLQHSSLFNHKQKIIYFKMERKIHNRVQFPVMETMLHYTMICLSNNMTFIMLWIEVLPQCEMFNTFIILLVATALAYARWIFFIWFILWVRINLADSRLTFIRET